jgi:peptidoglycan/LPS O-acetylase OafA/YrhL
MLESPTKKLKENMINSLTGIRAVAALWVLFGHFSYLALTDDMTLIDPIMNITSSAYAGVDLFFVLSGFIMSHVYALQMKSWDTQIVKNFWRNRIARIFPVYLFSTFASSFVFLVALWWGHQFQNEDAAVVQLENLFFNLLGIQEWIQRPSIYGPAWSVSAELLGYLLFPLVAIATFKLQRLPAVLGATGALLALYLLTEDAGFISDKLFQFLVQFLIGVLVWKMSFHLPDRYSEKLVKIARGVLWLCALVTVTSQLESKSTHFALTIFFSLLVYLYSLKQSQKTFLSRKSIVALGLASYSLYMTHRFIQYVWSAFGIESSPDYLMKVVVLAASVIFAIALSLLVYKALEEPARKRISQVIR